MDYLDVYWLTRIKAIPHEWPTRINVAGISLKLPDIAKLTCTVATLETENRIGDKQTIKLKWHHPVGGPQPLMICPACERAQKTLYCHRYKLTCRSCCGSVYISQCRNRQTRPRWQATKRKARQGSIPPSTPASVYRALAYHGR